MQEGCRVAANIHNTRHILGDAETVIALASLGTIPRRIRILASLKTQAAKYDHLLDSTCF
jgi:hypothetical protein